MVVLAHAFWQQVLGGDPQVIGRRLTFADGSREVVGVLAPGVRLPEPADVYQPLTYGPTFDPDTAQGRRSEFLTVVSRAREGSDTARVRADTGAIGQRLQQAFPGTNARLDVDAGPLVETVVGEVRTPLLMVLGAVVFVWLVACANVEHLLLARVSSRRAELRVRAALGATCGRILTKLLVESSVLGRLGGLLGLLIAQVGIRVLVTAEPAGIPRLDDVAMSWP